MRLNLVERQPADDSARVNGNFRLLDTHRTENPVPM
jgi:hypothetical protein